MKRVFVLLLTLFVLLVPSGAHSGRTDSQGGHTDRSTGEYHFHHGYPAHQHENGVCPYDFDDQTGQSSGTSSGDTEQSKDGIVIYEPDNFNPDPDGVYRANERVVQYEQEQAEESDESPRSFWSNVGYYLGQLPKALLALALNFLLFYLLCWLVVNLSDLFKLFKNSITTFRKAHARGLSCREYRRLTELREDARREARQMLRESGERFRAARALRFEILKRTLPLETFGFVPAQLVAQACGMPYDTTIGGDGLPKLIKAEDWGERYTFYVSSSGRAYHRTLQCSGAVTPLHALQLRGQTPCKRCQPTLPSLGWFDRYSHAAGQLIALHVPVVIVDEQSLC